ncbi:MAG: AraC family transcriptional regulator [Pseudomonadota bacterium]
MSESYGKPPGYGPLEDTLGIRRDSVDEDRGNRSSLDRDLEGEVSIVQMISGVTVTLESVTALRDHQFSGVIPASIVIRLPLGKDRPIVKSPLLRPYHPDLADAAVVANAKETRLDSIVRKGQSFNTLGVIAIPERVSDKALGQKLKKALEVPAVKPLFPSDRLRTLAHALFDPHALAPQKDLIAMSCAMELLATALDTLQSSQSQYGYSGGDAIREQKLEELRSRLIRNPQRPWKVEELSREFGVSSTTLRRQFRNAFGQTLGDYLRELRLLMAYEGMVEKGWSSSSAAYRIGYTHPSSFSHAFKERFGITPSRVTRRQDDQNS